MRWREFFAFLAAVASAVAFTAGPWLARVDGFSIDALFWLRHQILGSRYEAVDSPTAIIAIDEETYRRAPFASTPKALWTPQIAKVLEETLRAGAAVIGQDLILPTSTAAFLPDHDRDYMLLLRDAGREGRILLSKVQHSEKPISPFPGYSFAVGHEKNIRLVNLFRDEDDIIRRAPLLFESKTSDGQMRKEPSFALELARRSLPEGSKLEQLPDGRLALGGWIIPGSQRNNFLLNFNGGGMGLPVYSLADLLACAKAGKREFFSRHFSGKVVLLGAVLDVEDRKFTSARFITGEEGDWIGPRCVFPVMTELYREENGLRREEIPGVFVQATAVNTLLRRDVLIELPWWAETAVVMLVTACLAGLALAVSPGVFVVSFLGALLAWLSASVVIFDHGVVLPLVDPPMSALIASLALFLYRFTVTDKEKRRIRQSFSYYLPGQVIDRMVKAKSLPALGGESRELTVLFMDLAGFTRFSEKLAPTEVVEFMNRYLSEMTDIIEAHKGFVDKYVGDAIVAVFGAPLHDPDHARHAVAAAIKCQEELSRSYPDGSVRSRIGINSGEMLIGNIGSKRRFNYTVMGDAVNLAARLETANKIYGTGILLSDRTAKDLRGAVPVREIDKVRVPGREQPVGLFAPLQKDEREQQFAETFAHGLEEYRRGDFVAAAETLGSLSNNDGPARTLAARAARFAKAPPPQWDGIISLDLK